MIDLTPIFQALIALLAALITYKLVPWIRSKTTEQTQYNLETAARIAVYAAEQIFGSGAGKEKMDYAIEFLQNAGFTLDEEVLRATLESEVWHMNVYREEAFFQDDPPDEDEAADEDDLK